MQKLQFAILSLIAALLASAIWIEYGRPILALALYEEDYLAAAQECHEAAADWHAIERQADTIDRSGIVHAMRQSIVVSLMACYPKDRLERKLLSDGVSVHAVRLLDLEAREVANVDVSYFVRGLSIPQ